MTIKQIQLDAIKKANIKDNDDFCFSIIDMNIISKKLKNNNFCYGVDDYEKNELIKATTRGARFMLLVCENNTMNIDSLTLQPIDLYRMESLKALNIGGLSAEIDKLYKALKLFKPFNGGDIVTLGLDSEGLLDDAIVDISKL